MRRLLWSALLSVSFCLTFAGISWADTFTDTFDAPNFTLGQWISRWHRQFCNDPSVFDSHHPGIPG